MLTPLQGMKLARYFTDFSLSYTFGSIFNNIVNPRLRGGF